MSFPWLTFVSVLLHWVAHLNKLSDNILIPLASNWSLHLLKGQLVPTIAESWDAHWQPKNSIEMLLFSLYSALHSFSVQDFTEGLNISTNWSLTNFVQFVCWFDYEFGSSVCNLKSFNFAVVPLFTPGLHLKGISLFEALSRVCGFLLTTVFLGDKMCSAF